MGLLEWKRKERIHVLSSPVVKLKKHQHFLISACMVLPPLIDHSRLVNLYSFKILCQNNSMMIGCYEWKMQSNLYMYIYTIRNKHIQTMNWFKFETCTCDSMQSAREKTYSFIEFIHREKEREREREREKKKLLFLEQSTSRWEKKKSPLMISTAYTYHTRSYLLVSADVGGLLETCKTASWRGRW